MSRDIWLGHCKVQWGDRAFDEYKKRRQEWGQPIINSIRLLIELAQGRALG